jgi:hypothetical protein
MKTSNKQVVSQTLAGQHSLLTSWPGKGRRVGLVSTNDPTVARAICDRQHRPVSVAS